MFYGENRVATLVKTLYQILTTLNLHERQFRSVWKKSNFGEIETPQKPSFGWVKLVGRLTLVRIQQRTHL
mgnify:CR=1 FL=1